jgi:hypothetical protein
MLRKWHTTQLGAYKRRVVRRPDHTPGRGLCNRRKLTGYLRAPLVPLADGRRLRRLVLTRAARLLLWRRWCGVHWPGGRGARLIVRGACEDGSDDAEHQRNGRSHGSMMSRSRATRCLPSVRYRVLHAEPADRRAREQRA